MKMRVCSMLLLGLLGATEAQAQSFEEPWSTSGAGEEADASAEAPPERVEPAPPEEASDEGGYPVAYVARPLNLPVRHVRLDGQLQIARIASGIDPSVQLSIGAAIGVGEQLEFGVSNHRLGAQGDGLGAFGPSYYGTGGAVPVRLDGGGGGRFGSLQFYARYAALAGEDFDLSIDVGLLMPTQLDTPWALFVGLPMRARLTERFVIDASAGFSVAFFENPDDGHSPVLSLHFPIAGVINVLPQLFIAGRSGVFVPEMDFTFFTIPLALELGYTVAGERPLFDLTASFALPRMLVPGARDAFVSDYWVLSLGINGYIGL